MYLLEKIPGMLKKTEDKKMNPEHHVLLNVLCDFRSSSASLSKAVLDGVKALGGNSKGKSI